MAFVNVIIAWDVTNSVVTSLSSFCSTQLISLLLLKALFSWLLRQQHVLQICSSPFFSFAASSCITRLQGVPPHPISIYIHSLWVMTSFLGSEHFIYTSDHNSVSPPLTSHVVCKLLTFIYLFIFATLRHMELLGQGSDTS